MRNFFPQAIQDNIPANTNYPPQSSEDAPFNPLPGILMQYENLDIMEYENLIDMEYEFTVLPDLLMQYEDLDIMEYQDTIEMQYEEPD